MKTKRVIAMLLLMIPLISKAQELTVQAFTLSPTDIIPNSKLRKDLNGNPCALVKVQMVDDLDRVEGNVIGKIDSRGVEKWVHMTQGTKEFRLFPKHYLPVNISLADYGIDKLEGKRVYVLRLSNGGQTEESVNSPKEPAVAQPEPVLAQPEPAYQTPSGDQRMVSSAPDFNLYLQPAVQVGTMMGFGGNFGLYISDFNVEAYATMGMGKESVPMYNTSSLATSEANISGTMFGAKIGYGINASSSVRVTPQVGVGALNVSGDDVGSSAICATVGARIEIGLGKSFGISLTPEGQFALSKKEVFKALEEASSKIKGWGTGANLRVGVYVKF